MDPRDGPRHSIGFARSLPTIPASTLRPGVSPIIASDAEIFVNELIRSQSLLDYLRAKREACDWFILLPYLYGPVLHAVSTLKELCCSTALPPR